MTLHDPPKHGVEADCVDAVLASGNVALIGLCDPNPDFENYDGVWIETIDGYDQGETLPFSKVYERVQRLQDALQLAQVPGSAGTALALAILALEMVGNEHVEFNAHDFHKAVLGLAPYVMWTREPDFCRGETWAYDSQGKRFLTKLDLRELANPKRGEIAAAASSEDETEARFETRASKASAPVGDSESKQVEGGQG